MRCNFAVFVGLLIATGFSSAAVAGVVIDEQVTTTRNGAPGPTQNRQLLVQGHKEKMVSERNSFVIDLDQGTMTVIDPTQRVYAQMLFPPHGMSSNPAQQLDLKFQKTGKSSKVLNYSCEEYTGAADNGMSAVTTTGCFSGSAPGAAEFSEFTKAMGIKLKSANAMAGKMPSGIPLTMDSTRKVNAGFSMPGLSPDQAAKLKAILAKEGPQTTRTVVTKIATRELSAETFAVPAGYTRREMGQPPPATAAPGPGAPHTGIKVPE